MDRTIAPLSWFIAVAALIVPLSAQPLTVNGSVVISRPGKLKPDHSGAVLWLQALPLAPESTIPSINKTFRIVQKDKRFEPRVIAIPVGAHVAFPNLDPFFHNVFSMFDGKRFDLGLYEAGASRAARFDKPGVCYIFCNIHPEMTALIVAVESAYYAVSNTAGAFSIFNVPPGRYRVSLWHERAQPPDPGEFPREVTIASDNTSLGVIRLVDSGQLSVPHKNKYGHDYEPTTSGPAYK